MSNKFKIENKSDVLKLVKVVDSSLNAPDRNSEHEAVSEYMNTVPFKRVFDQIYAVMSRDEFESMIKISAPNSHVIWMSLQEKLDANNLKNSSESS